MSIVLVDANGYVADVGTNSGALAFMDWLEQSDDDYIKSFLATGVSDHPQELAKVIEALLNSSPIKKRCDFEVAVGVVDALNKSVAPAYFE